MGCDERFDDGVGRVDERKKLERLYRDFSLPAIAEKRRSLMPNSDVGYQLMTPYGGSTTHVICESLDLIVRLAVPGPKPQVNVARSDGMFEPKSKYCAEVTRAKRGEEGQHPTSASAHPGKMLEALAGRG